MRRTILIATLSALVGALVATPVAVYASHSFNDVPNTNTFHDDIAWLAEAGVTKGCNPPDNTEFCPDDEVTREQMAAFLRRFAQYLDAEDGTPGLADHATTADSAAEADSAASATQADHATTADSAVVADHTAEADHAADADHAATADSATTADNAQNAEKLDGFDAAELAPRAAFNSTSDAPDFADFTLSAEITAPARGILLMSGGIDAVNSLNQHEYFCRLEIDDVFVTGSGRSAELMGSTVSVNRSEDCTTSGAEVVDPGTYTIDFEVSSVDEATGFFDASVWVLWVPFDGTGAVPASITQLGDPDTVDEQTYERLDE